MKYTIYKIYPAFPRNSMPLSQFSNIYKFNILTRFQRGRTHTNISAAVSTFERMALFTEFLFFWVVTCGLLNMCTSFQVSIPTGCVLKYVAEGLLVIILFVQGTGLR